MEANPALSSNHQERESRAARTLGIVMGVFLICWLPFFLWMPVTAVFDLPTPPVVYSIILWIGYGNSVVNPFIYGFFNREFKSVIVGDLERLGMAKWKRRGGGGQEAGRGGVVGGGGGGFGGGFETSMAERRESARPLNQVE